MIFGAVKMIDYYKQIHGDLSDWNYLDLILEAYDKLEILLRNSLELQNERPIIARGSLIKAQLIILALEETLIDDGPDNILTNKLRSIYVYMLKKINSEKISHSEITLLINAIQTLRDSIRQLNSYCGAYRATQQTTTATNSLTIEA
jgi:flagellin-specific chaperone FliS